MNIFERFADLKARMTEWLADAQAEIDAIREVDEAMHRVPTQRPELEPVPEIPAPLPPPPLVTPGTVEVPPAAVGVPVTPVAPAVPTPVPVQPAPVVPPVTASTRAPKGRDRYVPDEIWEVADREFGAVGLDPDLGIGLEVWETGWYDGLPSAPSPAWSERNNPGGMKNPPEQFKRHGIVWDRDPDHSTYMRFPTWQMGIRAHAVFIGDSKLYKAVHDTTDLDAQVDVIGAGGYAEGSDSWRVGVKAKIRQVKALRAKRAGTRPAATPVTTDLGALILASAKRAQDLGDDFPYDPLTDDGNLGCANVVSWILRDAKVLTKLILNVDGVVDALLALGWREVSAPYQDGDVIAWKATPSSKNHQHVGIIDEEGAKVWAYNNSSENRKVVYEALTQGGRPIRCVLRHP